MLWLGVPTGSPSNALGSSYCFTESGRLMYSECGMYGGLDVIRSKGILLVVFFSFALRKSSACISASSRLKVFFSTLLLLYLAEFAIGMLHRFALSLASSNALSAMSTPTARVLP